MSAQGAPVDGGAKPGGPAAGQPGGPAAAPPEELIAPGPPTASRGRRILVRSLIWFASVLAVVAVFAVWANRQMLDPDNWADTSTRLLQNPVVREATATYVVEQLYQHVDVEAEIKSRLPTELKPLAGPLAGGVRSLATEVAKRALASPRIQEAWRQANRAADQTLVTVVNGGKGALLINHGEVTLDLASIVKEISNRLGLPDVSSKLPPSVARLRLLKSNEIKLVQDGGKALKGLALVLTILVPLLYALAIFLATGYRRRTLITVGIAAVLVGIIVLIGRTVLITQLTDSLVKTESVRPAAHAVLSIATSKLTEVAGAFIVIGVPLILAGWFAGPQRYARAARRRIAPFLRERPDWTYGIVTGVMLLIFIWQPIPSTGKLAGIIVYLGLALFGTYLLRKQADEEFPADPPAPAA
ncbi:MAG: hypothetical protein ACLQBB_09460 [Solirubrobacteraceae bacterium]